MREIHSLPVRKLRPLTSSDSSLLAIYNPVAHWQFNESGTTTTVADYHGSSNLTWTSSTTTSSILYRDDGSVLGGARSSASASQYAFGSSNSTQRSRMRGDFSVIWSGDVSTVSGTRTLLALGAAGESSATNYLIRLQIINGAINVFWEYGAGGTDVSFTTSGGVIAAGLNQVGVRRRRINSSLTLLDVLVNGRVIYTGTTSDSQLPTASDGTSATWAVGADIGGSNIANVVHYDCQVVGYAMTDDWFRAGCRRAFRTFDESKLLSTTAQGNYVIFHRVLVEDPEVIGADGIGSDQNMVDLDVLSGSWTSHGRPYLEDVEWGDDVDAAGATASFTVTREVFGWSAAPGMTDGSPLAPAGVNLLQVARRLKIETAIMPWGSDYADIPAYGWSTKFDGFISSVDWTTDPIKVNCRDRIAPLQWTICEPLASNLYLEAQYGNDSSPVSVETVLQQIIDDHGTFGTEKLRGGIPKVYTPVSPGWALRKRSIGFDPLHNVLSEKADQIGWQLRYVWNDVVKDFLLTFSEPDRAVSVALRTFDPDIYEELRSVEIDESNIRNYCHVVYSDTADLDNLGVPKRKRVSASDTTSISKYGRRYCQVAEETTSDINSATEAQTLADSVVADLAEPKVAIEMMLPEWPQVEISDYYAIDPDGRVFYAQQKLAVVGYRHTSQGTSIKLRGQPVSSYNGRIAMLSMPGSGGAPFRPPEAPAAITATPGPRSVELSFDYPLATLSAQFDQAELHLGTAAGFTPSASTLAKVVRGNRTVLENLELEKKYAQLIFRDKNNNVTSAVETNFTPDVAEKDLPTALTHRWSTIAVRGTTTSLDAVGAESSTVGTAAAISLNNQRFIRYTSVASPGSIAGVRSNVVTGLGPFTGRGSGFACRFSTAGPISAIKIFAGFSSSPSAIPTAAQQAMGFYYSSASSSGIFGLTCNGSSFQLSPQLATYSNNTSMHLSCGYDADANACWFKFNQDPAVFITSVIPSLTTDGYYHCIVEGNAEQIYFGQMSWIY